MTDSDIPLLLLIFGLIFPVLHFICSFAYRNTTEDDPRYLRNVGAIRVVISIISGIFFVRFLSIFNFELFDYIIAAICYCLIYLLFFTFLPEFLGMVSKENKGMKAVFSVIYSTFVGPCHTMELIAALITKGVTRKNPFRIKNDSEKEIVSMVNESHEKGEIMTQEANMIVNIFAFDDKDAKDIMQNRTQICAINGEENFREAIEVFKESHFSRFPVFIGNLDNIIGVIHMRELLEYSLEKTNFPKKIKDIPGLMHDVMFITETQSINTLFSRMQKEKSQMAIVKDEYGQTSGIISMEDILEEIVGNIFDEHDKEDKSVINRGNGVYIMFGKTELSEVEKTLDIEIKTKDFETLNGFLINEIGHIPKPDEYPKVEYGGFVFNVMSLSGNTINTVKIEKLK